MSRRRRDPTPEEIREMYFVLGWVVVVTSIIGILRG